MSEPKYGSGHAAAMGRLGLKELRNAASHGKDSIADTEIGLYGSLTQGQIADGMGGPGSGPEQENPAPARSLDEMRGNAKERADNEPGKGREQGGPERGRDK